MTERPRACFLLSANAAFSLFSTFFRSVRPLQLFSRFTFFCRIFNFRTKGITNNGDEIYNNYKHDDTHVTSIKVLIKSYGFFCNFSLVYINFLHWVSISNSALWNIDSVWLLFICLFRAFNLKIWGMSLRICSTQCFLSCSTWQAGTLILSLWIISDYLLVLLGVSFRFLLKEQTAMSIIKGTDWQTFLMDEYIPWARGEPRYVRL